MKGFDISHHNGNNAIEMCMSRESDLQFVIIKATEGKTWVDPMLRRNAADAGIYGLGIGFYHYARPENGNSPEDEAKHFVRTIAKYIGNAVLVLDYEGQAHVYGQDWALKFLDTVYDMTGVRPLIYLSGSYLKGYGKIARSNYGLWVASYTYKPGKYVSTSEWDIYAMWQYENTPFDLDEFNGSIKQFEAYAKVIDNNPKEPEGKGCCGCCCEGI